MRIVAYLGLVVNTTSLTGIVLIGNGHTLEASLQRPGRRHLGREEGKEGGGETWSMLHLADEIDVLG